MSIHTDPWVDGTPCWADLTTPDPQAASAFYASVLGWNIMDTGEDLDGYRLCLVDGHAAAGLMRREPESPWPPAWITYLASSDVDKTCGAVTANGGQVAIPPFDVADQGRVALATDPNGAVFGIWQDKSMISATLVNEPGGMVWNECLSRDPARARAFYSAVFGYEYTAASGTSDYTTIDGAGPGNTVGGIGPADGDTPARWRAYFVVDDVDEAVTAVRSGGGGVVAEPFDTEHGRMTGITDPHGAELWLGSGVGSGVV